MKAQWPEIIRRYCYLEGDFQVSHGPDAKEYIDLWRLTLQHGFVEMLAHALVDKFPYLRNATAIGGPAMGSLPISLSIARYLGKQQKVFVVRDRPKLYGTKRAVEGPLLTKDDQIVFIEDTTSTGTSMLDAISTLFSVFTHCPLPPIIGLISVVERGEGATDLLGRHGLSLDYLVHVEQIQNPQGELM